MADRGASDLRTPSGPTDPSLLALRRFANGIRATLDPRSRYGREFEQVLDHSIDVASFLKKIDNKSKADTFARNHSKPSSGERGRAWVNDDTWDRMSIHEKIAANLITGESRLMWCAKPATDFYLIQEIFSSPPTKHWRALSAPCSTGKEAYAIAMAAFASQVKIDVIGIDWQPSYVSAARTGILSPHPDDEIIPEVKDLLCRNPQTNRLVVRPDIINRCAFEVGNILTDALPSGEFDLVICRNFLGYFRGNVLLSALRSLIRSVRRGGLLILDAYVLGEPETAVIYRDLEARKFTRIRADACVFQECSMEQ